MPSASICDAAKVLKDTQTHTHTHIYIYTCSHCVRLVCSDAGVKYKYSGYEREGYPFPQKIRELKEKVENALPGNPTFNYCLVNRYEINSPVSSGRI